MATLDAKETIVHLAEAFGLKREDALRSIEETENNHRKLQSCPGSHDFSEVVSSYPSGTPRRYRCSYCKGEVDAVNASWYKQGVRDALKNVHPD